MKTCMFLCFHVFMKISHLVPTFAPQYIIMVLGLLASSSIVMCCCLQL